MSALGSRRLVARLAALALAFGAAVGLGCASGLTDGDRFFLAGDLVRAEAAYRDYLTSGRAVGNAESRARYRLGLIYALPESDLHDREKADRALQTLIEREPGSAWAQQATFILSMREERDLLAAELTAQSERADFLLGEVVRLEAEAEEAGAEAEDYSARAERLAAELAELRQSVDELSRLLAAREQELEQLKRIDLQTPP